MKEKRTWAWTAAARRPSWCWSAEHEELLYEAYTSNQGSPLDVVVEHLKKIYALGKERITIAGSCATGYGEELMKHAFHLDEGAVETMAHYEAARHFNPNVDYILDIGGQDIKCFQDQGWPHR